MNYATIEISSKLAWNPPSVQPIEWTLVGIVVGLLYKPRSAAAL